MDQHERRTREDLVRAAETVVARRLTHGSSGNISVRLDEDHLVVTPTGSRLGELTVDGLSVIDLHGRHVEGPPPTKEAFLHSALLRTRPKDSAVLHTHSLESTAVSCLPVEDPHDHIPAWTAYFAMRVGHVALLPYHAPGDGTLEQTLTDFAARHHTILLAHHGPVVSARDLNNSLDILEELEQTSALHLKLRGTSAVPLDAGEQQRLSAATP